MNAARPKTTWARRAVRISACFAVVLLFVLLACCRYFGVYRWRDVIAYGCMAMECDPVWKELAFRRVRQGDPVTKLIAIREPSQTLEYGPYQELKYYRDGWQSGYLSFTGITVYAKEGKLLTAVAWSCTWDHVFFQDKTEEERIHAEFSKYVAANSPETPSPDETQAPDADAASPDELR